MIDALMTNLGERVFRPRYGCDIQAALFGATERVNARTSAGSVELTVPDAAYELDADTSSGAVRIQVTDEPDAARLISTHTSSGDVTIRHR